MQGVEPNEISLDCKGIRCPMPIVKLSLAIKKLQAGDRVRIEATDAAFEADLIAWTRQLGHRLIEFRPGEVQEALVEKVPIRAK
jgi:tRNA 2-thiouridine synthesizing protein A